MASPSQPNSQRSFRTGKSIGSIVTLLVLVAASIFVWWNRQFLVDTVAYWQYQPSEAVAAIASRDQLTDNGKFIFYASRPSVDDKNTFNQACERKESDTAILGCYGAPKDCRKIFNVCYSASKIYIYNVTDPKLDGIKEVTAAHEMLHAVYERLRPDEKQTVNRLVEAEYEKLKSNPAYAERIAFYDRAEPGERDNELHSIIGTEVATVSPELETYYAKYFKDRHKVAMLYAGYNDAFTSLASQAASLEEQLGTMSRQIKVATTQYEADLKQVESDVTVFNDKADKGGFASPAVFSQERQALVARADAVSSERDALNKLVAKYNALCDQYNGIVTQSNNLYKSIDSTPAPAPKV